MPKSSFTSSILGKHLADKEMQSLTEALRAAIINKRAGGSGLILGRKAFQRPFKEGVALLQAVQDVHLEKSITIA